MVLQYLVMPQFLLFIDYFPGLVYILLILLPEELSVHSGR